MKIILIRITVLLVISLFTLCIDAQQPTPLDNYIKNIMLNHSTQGLAAIIIKDGKVAWTKGYGFADIAKNIPFTPNTVNAEIASLSKTFTATAVMQLIEQKKVRLDDDINTYLPFSVRNPYYPKEAITIRMLLNHTSSLYTNYDVGADKFDFNNAYFPKLGKYLYNIMNPTGDYYIDSVCFKNYKPGTKWNYCGGGYALLGYLVELISKTPFDIYCDNNIFEPLGMHHTAWHFSSLDTNTVAHPYQWSDEENAFVPCGFYEYPTYPEGQLKSSVIDLSKFLCMNMNEGALGSVRILKSATAKMMHSNCVLISDSSYGNASYGFGWAQIKINDQEFWGHHGRDQGISTEMIFNRTGKTGIIILTNSDDDGCSMIPCMNSDDLICTLFMIADTIHTEKSEDVASDYIYFPKNHDLSYWKKNISFWPAGAIPMKLGTEKFYDREQLASLLVIDNKNAFQDLTIQLIAAKLNIASGSDFSIIASTIDSVNNLIGADKLPLSPTNKNIQNEAIQLWSNIIEKYNSNLPDKISQIK